MSEFWRHRVIDQLERGVSLEQIDYELEQIRSINDDERAALWLLAWGEQQRAKPLSGQLGCSQQNQLIGADPQRPSSAADPITAALELALSGDRDGSRIPRRDPRRARSGALRNR
jgi:hypothetical protein